MAEILGIGCTHRPVMLYPDERWTQATEDALNDPAMPEEWKDPAKWPEGMRKELGNDFGTAEATRHRAIHKRQFAEARQAIDDFKPDVIIMWGDDQHENFREDLIPPFAVMAYEDQDLKPWKDRRSPPGVPNSYNPWGEPEDFTYRVRGQKEIGKFLTKGLIQDGFDMPYAYKPLHHPFPHSFRYTVLLLDDARTGFDYPIIPFHVNCYGSRVNAAEGFRLPLSAGGALPDLDPPSPNPSRCMEVGAATARIMAESRWRTVLMASSGWSHSFLTEKHYQLWPDVEADQRLYTALQEGDYDTWRRYTTAEIEDAGQFETLNWFCLMGAMEELGRKPDHSEYVRTYSFAAESVFAHYHA